MTNITLEDLRPAEGSTHKSKRVGRGRSSGHGKTSCRGHNGEGQRSHNLHVADKVFGIHRVNIVQIGFVVGLQNGNTAH